MRTAVSFRLLILALLLSCAPGNGTRQDSADAAEPFSGKSNEIARFLAGAPIQNPSPEVARLLETPAYKQHKLYIDQAWASIEQASLGPMREWKKEQLNDACGERLAFYPLSGADFGNFFTMFPDCKQYLMIALEDPGSVPDPFGLGPAELASGLQFVQRMVGQISLRNYFFTESMKYDTANPHMAGVTPAILIFAVRLGLDIRNIEAVRMDDSGKIVPTGNVPKEQRLQQISGMRITFRAPGDSEDRTLQFLRLRIGPDVSNPDKPEGKFFKQFGDFTTMFKSAEYLMHFKLGEEFRAFVLDRSTLVVQDDSGIPFKLLDSKWNVKCYGDYVKPYPLLQYTPQVQPEMAEAFKKERYPLPFPFGYGFYQGRGKANLVIARKK
jgi:hypothetical protein